MAIWRGRSRTKWSDLEIAQSDFLKQKEKYKKKKKY